MGTSIARKQIFFWMRFFEYSLKMYAPASFLYMPERTWSRFKDSLNFELIYFEKKSCLQNVSKLLKMLKYVRWNINTFMCAFSLLSCNIMISHSFKEIVKKMSVENRQIIYETQGLMFVNFWKKFYPMQIRPLFSANVWQHKMHLPLKHLSVSINKIHLKKLL